MTRPFPRTLLASEGVSFDAQRGEGGRAREREREGQKEGADEEERGREGNARGSSFPGTKTRSTPSSVMMARRIVPPLDPSRLIASARAAHRMKNVREEQRGENRDEERGRTLGHEFDRLLLVPIFAVRGVAIAENVCGPGAADGPGAFEEAAAERDVVHGAAVDRVPPGDDDARAEPVPVGSPGSKNSQPSLLQTLETRESERRHLLE